jgi:two-component system cell cycle response regulator
VNEPAGSQPTRPKVLLAGDPSARPDGLERALSRAGFQLLELTGRDSCPAADAILITLTDLEEHLLPGLLPVSYDMAAPPRLVVISGSNPGAAAAALELGASDALVAPVHLPELCARLYARIRERRQSSPPSMQQVSPGAMPAFEGNGRGLDSRPSAEELESRAQELEERVQEEFERARRYSLSFSLILLGIDELGNSDETLGEGPASRLRDEVGQTLRRELRVPDLVVPYSADEFAIVLPETGQAGARQSVIRVRERLTRLPFDGDPRLGPTRFSAGIVTYPHPAAVQPEDLFAMAEAALMRGRAQSIERIGVAV